MRDIRKINVQYDQLAMQSLILAHDFSTSKIPGKKNIAVLAEDHKQLDMHFLEYYFADVLAAIEPKVNFFYELDGTIMPPEFTAKERHKKEYGIALSKKYDFKTENCGDINFSQQQHLLNGKRKNVDLHFVDMPCKLVGDAHHSDYGAFMRNPTKYEIDWNKIKEMRPDFYQRYQSADGVVKSPASNEAVNLRDKFMSETIIEESEIDAANILVTGIMHAHPNNSFSRKQNIVQHLIDADFKVNTYYLCRNADECNATERSLRAWKLINNPMFEPVIILSEQPNCRAGDDQKLNFRTWNKLCDVNGAKDMRFNMWRAKRYFNRKEI